MVSVSPRSKAKENRSLAEKLEAAGRPERCWGASPLQRSRVRMTLSTRAGYITMELL